MIRQLRLADDTFVLDLPDGWTVDWRRPFGARLLTTIREAPILVSADCFYDPEGLANNRVGRWLTPYDDGLQKADPDAGLSYLVGLSSNLRGRGPHILVVDIHGFPPDRVRRIEFAIPLGETAPQRRDPRENTAFLAWAVKHEPLSTLLSLLPKVRLAREETALDRVANHAEDMRVTLLGVFHVLLPRGWSVLEDKSTEDAARFRIRDPADRSGTHLWFTIQGRDLPPGAAPDVNLPDLVTGIAGGLAERSGEFGPAPDRFEISYPAPNEALLHRYQPCDGVEGVAGKAPMENLKAIRLAIVSNWYFTVIQDFVYPVARLADPEFLALRDDLWGRFLDGWIAPEV